jgi:hypothetical protein
MIQPANRPAGATAVETRHIIGTPTPSGSIRRRVPGPWVNNDDSNQKLRCPAAGETDHPTRTRLARGVLTPGLLVEGVQTAPRSGAR